MATFAFFISEQDVKKNTPIDENVDSKLLQTAMRTAQDIYIRDILGSTLYDKLCDDINGAGLSGDYLTLVNINGICVLCATCCNRFVHHFKCHWKHTICNHVMIQARCDVFID